MRREDKRPPVAPVQLTLPGSAVSNGSGSKAWTTRAPERLRVLLFHGFHVESKTPPSEPYLAAVVGAAVPNLLDEVEDEPGRGDDHQHDEGNGNKDQRAAIDVFSGSEKDRDQDGQVPIQVGQQLFAVRLGDHQGHRVAGTCRQQQSTQRSPSSRVPGAAVAGAAARTQRDQAGGRGQPSSWPDEHSHLSDASLRVKQENPTS